MSKDLVHVTSEDNLPPNGQLHAAACGWTINSKDLAEQVIAQAIEQQNSRSYFTAQVMGLERGVLVEAIAAAVEAVTKAVHDATIDKCASKIDTIAEMTTEPQATAYRFAAYRIRSLKTSPQRQGDRPVAPHDEREREPS